jgi:hypothetical protein
LTDSATNARVILEVSGTDEGSLGSVVKAKIDQAKNSDSADQCKPAVCWYVSRTPKLRFGSTMEIAELIERVTKAILHAESFVPGSFEAQSAFRDVSTLEEDIAAATSSRDVEGALARVGAVSAAIKAGEYLRALQLGRRYVGELVGVKAQARLQQLLEEAERETQRAAADEPQVAPVTFHLRSAA